METFLDNLTMAGNQEGKKGDKMKPIKFGWYQGLVDVFVGVDKEFVVPDSEYGSPVVSNLPFKVKTVVIYSSRSGLSGSGLLFMEGEGEGGQQNFKKIPVVLANDPAFYRIVERFPFAVVNRQQKEIEIVWSDYSSTLISFENGKGEIQQFSPDENRLYSGKLILEDQFTRIFLKTVTVFRSRVGTVRISDPNMKILAIKLYDGVWEHWNWGRDLSPSYLLRSNEEALRFFINKKPQPRLIFGSTFSWNPNYGPTEDADYVDKTGNFFIMKTNSYRLSSCLAFDEIPKIEGYWYYLVPQESWEGLGFYSSDVQFCETVAELLTEATED